MKFEDSSQNLRARLRFVQALVIVMLGLLSVRLYVLQVVRGARDTLVLTYRAAGFQAPQ